MYLGRELDFGSLYITRGGTKATLVGITGTNADLPVFNFVLEGNLTELCQYDSFGMPLDDKNNYELELIPLNVASGKKVPESTFTPEIFKDIKFGDKLELRGGGYALYCEPVASWRDGSVRPLCYILGVGEHDYEPNGKYNPQIIDHKFDIIGRWAEKKEG